MGKIEKQVLRFIRARGCISGPEISLEMKIDTVTLDGVLRSLENEGLISIDLLGNCRSVRVFNQQKPEPSGVIVCNNSAEPEFPLTKTDKGEKRKEKERRDIYVGNGVSSSACQSVKAGGENTPDSQPPTPVAPGGKITSVVVVAFREKPARLRARDNDNGPASYYFTSISAIYEKLTREEIGCGRSRLWNAGLPWTSRDGSVTITREPVTRKTRKGGSEE